MRHNFGDGIVFDRDTSQPRERFRGRRRFMWPEEEKSTKKLSDSIKKYKFKSFNQIDENANSKDKDNKIEEEKNENKRYEEIKNYEKKEEKEKGKGMKKKKKKINK